MTAPPLQPPAITALLARARRGEFAARNELAAAVYPQLRRIAAGAFRHERPGHTLQPTLLASDAYLHVVGVQTIDWRDRAQFFAVAAAEIRRLLVDHARQVNAAKRGGGAVKVPIEERHHVSLAPFDDHLALHEALEALAREHSRAATVVELKYFGGMTDSDIAEVVHVSMPTVARDWKWARSWLFARLALATP